MGRRGFPSATLCSSIAVRRAPLVVEGNNSLLRIVMAACASLSLGLNIFTCSTAFNEVIMISNYRFFLVKVQAQRDLHPLLPEQ